MAGVADLQSFLEKGFRTVTAVDDVHAFLAVMEARMTDVFRRVFTADTATLSTTPIEIVQRDDQD